MKISEGLDQSDYDSVKEKFDAYKEKNGNYPQLWCHESGECACMGCANKSFTFAEWECWRKYNPEFNKTSHN